MKFIPPSFEVMACPKNDACLAFLERIGRVAYKSEDKIVPGVTSHRFVKSILKRGHESVIEHASITVKFIIDRGISHELVRHRLCSFTQASTRYVLASRTGDIEFIRPCFWDEITDGSLSNPLYENWANAMQAAETFYKMQIAGGAKPEEARTVLPHSAATEIVVTGNLRNWRLILKLRTAKAAHPQMREVMRPLLVELNNRIPLLFEDLCA